MWQFPVDEEITGLQTRVFLPPYIHRAEGP